MANNNKQYKQYRKKKPMGIRVFMVVLAALLVVGIAVIPLRSWAEGNNESITVQSFETGKLSEAISEAADGTDYNFIKNVAVLSGTLNAGDYSALLSIPNLEILELAGTETENGVIPENAIPSRNQLSLVTLPKNTVEIGKSAFSGNQKLKKVTMPASVKRIGDYAFAYCESLENIPVSDSIEYIGEGAFQDCKSITEFVIPGGITEIYPNTFSKCGFESISIGPNVKKIGASVFADCNALKNIYAYGKDAPALDNDVFRNVSANIHCYEDSEESYQSGWAQQNMTITADLTGEYTLSDAAPAEPSANTPEASNADSEPEAAANEPETEADSPEAAANETEAAAPANAGTAADTVQTSQSGGLSVGIVIVIVVMAMIIAVLATILIMNSKKSK